MPQITEELVRRRAEHNNCEIATLEELSLHQQDIERIEHLDKWCRDLKILYLQNNLIGRIENVSRLKQLTYLNLALNNIEIIENLEGCEFLQKLDLTVNFVGDLLSIESLKCNHHLQELYLTGNPCIDYEGYREFVVATLPQLKTLDGKDVTKSERILANQRLKELRNVIAEQQKAHQEKREREKREYEERKKAKKKKYKDGSSGEMENRPGFNRRWYTDTNAHVGGSEEVEGPTSPGGNDQGGREEEGEEEFMDESVPYTPESRIDTSNYIAAKRKAKAKEPDGPKQHERVRRLEKDGKMLNVNEGRYGFHLSEDEISGCYKLEVDCPRFMDTSLVDCDIQPTYVRVTIKGKILQVVLMEEVSPDNATAQRSQTTGKLLLTMPKAKPYVKPAKSAMTSSKMDSTSHMTTRVGGVSSRKDCEEGTSSSSKTGGTLLEIDPSLCSKRAELANIVRPPSTTTNGASVEGDRPKLNSEKEPSSSPDFVDDPDVPPLI